MHLRNGFLLLEVALFVAISMMGIIFFVATVRTYVAWHKNSQCVLANFLYHYHAFTVLQRDLSSATNFETSARGLIIQNTTLDDWWQEKSSEITYVNKDNGLYREKITFISGEKSIKSSLWLAPSSQEITYVQQGKVNKLLYGIPNSQPLQAFIAPLATI